MFMSYSVGLYLVGLTLLVCSPWIRRDLWGGDSNIAVMYVSVLALGGRAFVSCLFWVYKFVDMEKDVFDVDESGGQPTTSPPPTLLQEVRTVQRKDSENLYPFSETLVCRLRWP